MSEQRVDIRSEMPVFQAQRAKVEAFVVLQELPRSFDATLDRLTKTAVSLRKGTVAKDEAVRALAEVIRRDIPELRINLMEEIRKALERMDQVNNRLANELVQMQIKQARESEDGKHQ